MRSLSDLYDIYVTLTQALAKDGGELPNVEFRVLSDGSRAPILHGSASDTLRVLRIVYASPGLSDFAGLGKAMEEFNKLVLGIFDRITSSGRRRLDLQSAEFELSQKKQQSEIEAEFHREKVIHERLENRQLNAKVVREELRLFDELYSRVALRSDPDAFERLLALATRRGGTLAELVQVGKITGVEKIEAAQKERTQTTTKPRTKGKTKGAAS
jgi:hypothetical protein